MRAAKAISLGLGRDKADNPINFFYNPGDEIDDAHLEHIPEHLILENLATESPDELTREQLMMMAGVGAYSDDPDERAEAAELNEDEVREGLSALRTKADLVEWFLTIRPELSILDPERMNRQQMEDAIVQELTSPPDED